MLSKKLLILLEAWYYMVTWVIEQQENMNNKTNIKGWLFKGNVTSNHVQVTIITEGD